MSPKKSLIQKKKAGKSGTGRKYDSAWKEVIVKLFEDFLEFFFPDFHQAINFGKKIEFLDTGLRPVVPFSSMGDRIADVVVKVHLAKGQYYYICIFIHIEVQGQPQGDFMEKMYIYNYRLFDKRIEPGVPVISAAILTDDNVDYRPDEYLVKFCRFELRMKIPVVKIIDYKFQKELREKLDTSNNPMALVVRAQLKSMEINKMDGGTKATAARELIRECYKAGYSRKKIQTLVKFIEWVIRLPKNLEQQLKEEIKKIEEEFNMPYLASWERSAMRKGKLKGKLEGVTDEKIRTALEMLKEGFGKDIISKITGLHREEIERLAPTSH